MPLPIFNATVKRTVNNYNKYTSQLKLEGKRKSLRVRDRENHREKGKLRDGGLNDKEYAKKNENG